MQIEEFQSWVRTEFSSYVDPMSSSQVLAFLLEQSGQLAQAVIHDDADTQGRELADVLLVLVSLANKQGVDLQAAIQSRLLDRGAEEVMRNVND